MTAEDNKKIFLKMLVDGKGDLHKITSALNMLPYKAEEVMKFKKDISYVERVIDRLEDVGNDLLHLKSYFQDAPAEKIFKP